MTGTTSVSLPPMKAPKWAAGFYTPTCLHSNEAGRAAAAEVAFLPTRPVTSLSQRRHGAGRPRLTSQRLMISPPPSPVSSYGPFLLPPLPSDVTRPRSLLLPQPPNACARSGTVIPHRACAKRRRGPLLRRARAPAPNGAVGRHGDRGRRVCAGGRGRKARPVVLPRLVCRFMAAAAAVVVATTTTTMAGAGGPVLNGADAGAAGLKEAAGMYEQLRAEWNRKNLNLGKCGDLLGRLKVGGGGPGNRRPHARTRSPAPRWRGASKPTESAAGRGREMDGGWQRSQAGPGVSSTPFLLGGGW